MSREFVGLSYYVTVENNLFYKIAFSFIFFQHEIISVDVIEQDYNFTEVNKRVIFVKVEKDFDKTLKQVRDVRKQQPFGLNVKKTTKKNIQKKKNIVVKK